MKKYLIVLQIFITAFAFANKDFSYQDLSGKDFSNQDLTGANFEGANLTNTNFNGSNLTNAIFTPAIIYDTKYFSLENTDFTDAIIKGAFFYGFSDWQIIEDFPYSEKKASLTLEQLYSTVSYKNNDLGGDRDKTLFMGQYFNNVNFEGFNLKNVNFMHCDFTNANFNNAIINGTNFYNCKITAEQLYSTISYKNKDLSNVYLTRYYEDYSTLDLSQQSLSNSTLDGCRNIILSDTIFENTQLWNCRVSLGKSSIILNMKDNNTPAITFYNIEGIISGSFNLSEGTLIVNLTDEFVLNDKEINIMSWDDGSTITGFDKLVKGENLILKQNGVEFNDFWSFEVRSDGLYISVPEPSTYAVVIGAIALAVAVYRRRK